MARAGASPAWAANLELHWAQADARRRPPPPQADEEWPDVGDGAYPAGVEPHAMVMAAFIPPVQWPGWWQPMRIWPGRSKV